MTYGGDFGDRPTDGDFSGNGIAYGGKRKPSPKMQEVKYNYQNIEVVFENDSEFTVINKNLFTNTDEFDALVSKRQYKSHIGIRDALKIIIDHTNPSPNAP